MDSLPEAAVYGGAAEVLQNAFQVHAGAVPAPVVFTETPEQPGIRQAELDLKGTTITALIVNGLANARKVMDSIRQGECRAALVEIIDCHCGGQQSGELPCTIYTPKGTR